MRIEIMRIHILAVDAELSVVKALVSKSKRVSEFLETERNESLSF